jgi:hypothetical protein
MHGATHIKILFITSYHVDATAFLLSSHKTIRAVTMSLVLKSNHISSQQNHRGVKRLVL